MNKFLRPRNYLLAASILLAVFLYWSDPNGGALTTVLAAQLATPVIAVLFSHWARKALFDYLDMGDLYRKAMETPIGAAIIFASLCLVLFALLGLFGSQVRAQDVTTYIPKQAYQNLHLLRREQQVFWSDHPKLMFSQL